MKYLRVFLAVSLCCALHACGEGRGQGLDHADAQVDRAAPTESEGTDDASVLLPPDADRDASGVDASSEPVDAGEVVDAAVGDSSSDATLVDVEPVDPVSKFCGDAIRDPLLEECDDGTGTELDLCTPDCRVRTGRLGSATPDAGVTRSLGRGPHPLAAADAGMLLSYVEGSALKLQPFDSVGHRVGEPVTLRNDIAPIDEAQPVVAALAQGQFALAFADGADGTPDVRLGLIDAHGQLQGPLQNAHESPSGLQREPDLLWVDGKLVVTWTDLLDIRYRSFDAQLQPLGPEQGLATSSAIESGAVLAAWAPGWAAAYRANRDGLPRVEVVAGNQRWWTPQESWEPSSDRPTLVAVDAERLLLVYGVTADANLPDALQGLRFAILERSKVGQLQSVEVRLVLPGTSAEQPFSHRRPSMVRIGDQIYMSWESASPDAPRETLALLARVELSNDAVAVVDVMVLPRDGAEAAAQRSPHLAVSALSPRGALAFVWEQQPAGAIETELGVVLRPWPFVMLAGPD
jgi:hypothetical protein